MAGRNTRAARWVGLLTGSLFLAACSSTTFLYNQLDAIVPWYVDDYVELSGSQERQLDLRLQPFLDWHRVQELPRYLELLDQIEAGLDESVSSRELAAIYSGVEVAWLRLEAESLDWLLELGASLSDEQVQEFLVYLQEKQADYEEEYLERDNREYREDSYDSFADSLQSYLGRLSPEQKRRLRAATLDLSRSDAVWLQERADWTERLAVILQRQPGWQEQVREAIARRNETVSRQYQQTFEHNLKVILNAVADVLNDRTGKQDKHLRGELRNLREDLETLIAQGSSTRARPA